MRKMLFVGINKYPQRQNWLNGCVNDINDWMAEINAVYGKLGDQIHYKALFDSEATTDAIKSGLRWLVKDVGPGDIAAFFYSGHGTQVPTSNSDEPDGKDECICPWDLDWNQKIVKDDDFVEIFANLDPDAMLLNVLDCCLSKDTKISLLNGSIKTIKEMADEGGEYWVYSCKENGEIVPGKAHSARITGNRQLIKITLDNGEFFECTEDHKIMLSNGTYKEAGNLKENDSLMPLYKKYNNSLRFDGKELSTEYEQIYNISQKTGKRHWVPTHQMVRDFYDMYTKEKSVCHHKNFNSKDNTPENLQMVSWREHIKMHGDLLKENNKKIWEENSKLRQYRKTEEYRKSQAEKTRNAWQDEKLKKKHLDGVKRRIQRDGPPTFFKDFNSSDANKKRAILIGKWWGYIRREKISKLDYPFKEWLKTNATIEEMQNAALKVNHRVLKIEKTNKVEPVYDLTVDEFHNFALSCGIFVHNCHSGDATREIKPYLHKFLVPESYDETVTPMRIMKDIRVGGRYEKQKGILISGCGSQQTSADALIDGRYNGALTYFLLKTLRRTPGISYKDLVTLVCKEIKAAGYDQIPELNCNEEAADWPFLGGPIAV